MGVKICRRNEKVKNLCIDFVKKYTKINGDIFCGLPRENKYDIILSAPAKKIRNIKTKR